MRLDFSFRPRHAPLEAISHSVNSYGNKSTGAQANWVAPRDVAGGNLLASFGDIFLCRNPLLLCGLAQAWSCCHVSACIYELDVMSVAGEALTCLGQGYIAP